MLVGVYVLNGLLLPVELFAILRLINEPELMGEHVNGPIYNVLAWGIAIVVSAAVAGADRDEVVGWFR